MAQRKSYKKWLTLKDKMRGFLRYRKGIGASAKWLLAVSC